VEALSKENSGKHSLRSAKLLAIKSIRVNPKDILTQTNTFEKIKQVQNEIK